MSYTEQLTAKFISRRGSPRAVGADARLARRVEPQQVKCKLHAMAKKLGALI